MLIKAQKLAGFRDFLPQEAEIRESVIKTLKEVFYLYGFSPLETPAIEYEETLLGKYGKEADKLIYLFKDRGRRKIGLRYDLTVPLARVIASYQNLPLPFKRYQIQPVWRAEKPQKGRFREFIQCDADIIGSSSFIADAEIIVLAYEGLKKLGFSDFKILVNERSLFKNLPMEIIIALDKIEKIGEEKVIEEIIQKGYQKSDAKNILDRVKSSQPTKRIKEVFSCLSNFGVEKKFLEFSPTLARGLEYYTGMVFEVKIDNFVGGSVAGGGRYDNLISQFTGKNLPAVGFSFGIDRLIEALKEKSLFSKFQNKNTKKVLVTIFSPEFLKNSLGVISLLRQNQIESEIFLDPQVKINKQLKYADKKGISWVIIIGPDEIRNKSITIKNMQTGKQEVIPESKLIAFFKN